MREIDTGWIGDGGSCGVKPVLCAGDGGSDGISYGEGARDIGDGGTKIISRDGWGGNSAGDLT